MPISTFLNGRASTRLRGAKFLAFSDTGNIQRRTATSDSGGGASWAWNTVGTAACRVYPVSIRGQGRLTGGALDEHTTHFGAFPVGTSIDTPDRVVIAGRGTFDVTLALNRTDALTRVVELMQV
jgi:hypothetical protein